MKMKYTIETKIDNNYLIELLLEAEKHEDDLIGAINEFGMSDKQRKRYEHTETKPIEFVSP